MSPSLLDPTGFQNRVAHVKISPHRILHSIAGSLCHNLVTAKLFI